MRPEDARSIAAHVLNFFGFNERIIDNVLEPDDRDTFYMLEDTGILETERDETTLYDGRGSGGSTTGCSARTGSSTSPREETEAMKAAGEADVVYSSKPPARERSDLPHGEHGTGMAAHAVYHELGDEIWLERRTAPAPPEPKLGSRRSARPAAARPKRSK